MSILDMDVSPRRRAAYIRSRGFATIRKGYDQDQVRQFLEQVAGWFEDMETDLAESRAAAAAMEQANAAAASSASESVAGDEAGDPYAAMGAHVAEVVRHVEEHARSIREEAERDAQRTLEEARRESIGIRQRAEEDADRVRGEAAGALDTARVEAERTVAALSERRNALAAELHATRTRLMGIVSQLEEEQESPQEGEAAGTPGRSWTSAPAEDSSSFIPEDDPRRDQLPLDLPVFSPPPLPSPPSSAGTPNGVSPPEGTEVFEPPEIVDNGADDPPAHSVGGSDPVPEAVADQEQGPAESAEHIEPDEPFPQPDEPGASLWGRSGAGEPTPDMSLPDFPSIDIPMLEEEGPVD